MLLRSGAFQLGILLHQLLQAEARKLYRNLGFFAFSFSLVDGSFAIFGMADLLAGTESAFAGGFCWRCFGDGELLAAAGKEFGDVLDGVVGLGRGGGFLPAGLRCARPPGCTLVFVFIRIVNVGIMGFGVSPRWTPRLRSGQAPEGGRPHMARAYSGCAAAA